MSSHPSATASRHKCAPRSTSPIASRLREASDLSALKSRMVGGATAAAAGGGTALLMPRRRYSIRRYRTTSCWFRQAPPSDRRLSGSEEPPCPQGPLRGGPADDRNRGPGE